MQSGLFKRDGTCVSENPFGVSIVGDPGDSISNQATRTTEWGVHLSIPPIRAMTAGSASTRPGASLQETDHRS